MRKYCLFFCLGVFCLWILLLIAQIWLPAIGGDTFVKITFTLAGLFMISLAIFIVLGQLQEDKTLRDNDYIN